MTSQTWATLSACVGELAVAVLVLLRAFRSPLAMPLLALSVDLFAWNFAQLAWRLTGDPRWHLLDMVASPLGTAFAFHFMLVFLGRSRHLRWLLALAYALSGAIAGVAALALVVPGARRLALSHAWPAAFLGCLLPLTVVTLVLLLGHVRRVASADERTRTWLLLVAVSILSPLASTELWADLGLPVPRLGSVGIFTFNVILSVAALRFRLFDLAPSRGAAVTAALLVPAGVVAYLSILRLFQANAAVVVFGTAAVTVILLAAARFVWGAIVGRRNQVIQLATLGRMAAQMGHDLKNPLSAAKGAAQFLREERVQGRSIDERTEFLDLLVDQLDRVKIVVDRYQRLGRVEPVRAPLHLNELVRHLVVLQRFASDGGAVIKTELAPELPVCSADGDLIAGALENLLQNAFEAGLHDEETGAITGAAGGAAPGHARQAEGPVPVEPGAPIASRGGHRGAPMTITVRTGLGTHHQTQGVMLSVEDTGAGMNARTRERALDDFYTTKASGSGLGLAFVRRVAQAHGGDVMLFSREGMGTTVRLFLPLEAE